MKKIKLLKLVVLFSVIIVFCACSFDKKEEVDVLDENSNIIIEELDENFDIAIKEVLGKSYNELSEEEFEDVLKLDISNKNINSLNGIEKFINLEELNAYNNNLEDITFLKDLEKILYVRIWNNPLKKESAEFIINYLNTRYIYIAHDEIPIKESEEIIEVNSYKEYFYQHAFGNVALSFKVRESNEDDWKISYDIYNFDYEWGYKYKIKVKRKEGLRSNAVMDAIDYHYTNYTFLELIEKEEKNTEEEFEVLLSNYGFKVGIKKEGEKYFFYDGLELEPSSTEVKEKLDYLYKFNKPGELIGKFKHSIEENKVKLLDIEGITQEDLIKKTFKELISENFGKDYNELTQEEFENTLELNIQRKNITDLDGIEKFKNLEKLLAFENNIEGIEVLKELKKLNNISISQNPLSKESVDIIDYLFDEQNCEVSYSDILLEDYEEVIKVKNYKSVEESFASGKLHFDLKVKFENKEEWESIDYIYQLNYEWGYNYDIKVRVKKTYLSHRILVVGNIDTTYTFLETLEKSEKLLDEEFNLTLSNANRSLLFTTRENNYYISNSLKVIPKSDAEKLKLETLLDNNYDQQKTVIGKFKHLSDKNTVELLEITGLD